MNRIVAYDIADPKRLQKIAKIMKDYGTRVQKSIFELHIDALIFSEMKERIETTIEPEVDGVKYYRLCEKCAGTKENIGKGVCLDPESEFYIL